MLLVTVAWWLTDTAKRPLLPGDTLRHVPEYYMQDFTLTVTGADGRPHRWVKADYLVYYQDDNTTHLTNAEVAFAELEGPWRLEARTGVITDDDQIALRDGVVVRRPAMGEQREGIEAHAETLNLDLTRAYAETDDPVKIIAEAGTIEADGMRVYIAEDHLELLGNVRGRYAAP